MGGRWNTQYKLIITSKFQSKSHTKEKLKFLWKYFVALKQMHSCERALECNSWKFQIEIFTCFSWFRFFFKKIHTDCVRIAKHINCQHKLETKINKILLNNKQIILVQPYLTPFWHSMNLYYLTFAIMMENCPYARNHTCQP